MRHLPRFALADDAAGPGIDGTVCVTGGELHHMRDVLRLSPGTEVVLYRGDGTEYAGRIAAFEPNAAVIAIAGTNHNPPPDLRRLILAAGIIKAARMDLLIEKAAELDAAEFWPLICSRSLIREPGLARQHRWRRISLAAAKQSLRSRAMAIGDPVDVNTMAANVRNATLAVTCVPGAEPLGALLRRTADSLKARPAIVIIAVGPEGDFTAEELAAMRQAGFVAAGLGGNRLRSETAALAALSIAAGIFSELEEMEPARRAAFGRNRVS
jgi:16S rRNA (uracil1498-N3)-methyltransferase